MKKLVKTAKQQFEERRKNLTYRYQYELSETEIYYAYEGVNAYFYILRENNGEYKEIAFGERYEAFVFSEMFLGTMAEYFRDHNLHIKPLFDWYASADHDCEPFTLMDIWMLDLNKAECVYEDIYEEVPDVRIITAKEQWEEDSKSAKVLYSSTEKTLKVYVSRSQVVFYDSEDIYSRSIFPSLEVMRNDALFVGRLTESMSEANMYDDIAIFLRWVRTGGDFPLPLSVIYHSEYSNYKFEDYKDKELPQEHSITKKDFSTEITDLKERMIKHIEELHKQGMTLDSDSFLENAYSITWSDGSYYACENLISCKLTKSDEGVLCFSETQVNDKDVTYDSPLSMLTINTLWSIIDAMR